MHDKIKKLHDLPGLFTQNFAANNHICQENPESRVNQVVKLCDAPISLFGRWTRRVIEKEWWQWGWYFN